jgi:hypothetical protein
VLRNRQVGLEDQGFIARHAAIRPQTRLAFHSQLIGADPIDTR